MGITFSNIYGSFLHLVPWFCDFRASYVHNYFGEKEQEPTAPAYSLDSSKPL